MIWQVWTLFCLMGLKAESNRFILVHPQRQSVTINSTIILQCRVPEIKNIRVHWVKNGFGLGDTRADIRQYGQTGNIFRYDLPLDIEKGQYDLQITNVNLNDEGEFYCQTSVDNQAITSERAQVQVYVASQAPKIIQITNEEKYEEQERFEGSPVVVDNGQFMIIRCQANGGRPGAKLSWSIGNEVLEPDVGGNFKRIIIGSITVEFKKDKPEAKLRDSISTLKAKVNQLLNGKSIQCSANNKGYEHFKLPSAKAKIEIHVAPTVTMDVIPRRIDNEFIENEWTTISCLASGRPDQFVWKWFVNEKLLENERSNTYTIQLGRTMNRAKIKCVANNNKEGYAQQTVRIRYGPQFINNTLAIYPRKIGEDVKMSCQADSNPPATVYWQRESSTDILSHGTVLFRQNIQELDFGIYVCTATAENFTPIFKRIYLAMRGKPFVSENPDRSVAIGKSIQIKCVIASVPEPKSNELLWFFRGQRLLESNKHVMFQEGFLGGTTSNLQINNVESADLGEYNCSVTTEMGSNWRTMTLYMTSQMPLILIVGGTIFVTLVLLIVIIIVCVCKRGLCSNKYQKGSPINRKNHFQEPVKNNHMEMDYQCQPNIFQWMPPNQCEGAKSSFVRYGQDTDDRSSVRNGSVTQFRGLDMCSTYTSSVPGSQSGEKQIRSTDEEEFFPPTNPAMICSIHGTPTVGGITTRISPCNLYSYSQSQMQQNISPPNYNFASYPNPPFLQNYLACANTNFALPSYPVHSLPSESGGNGYIGSPVPATLPPIEPNNANHIVDLGSSLPMFLKENIGANSYISSYISPGMNPKQKMYNTSLVPENDNNTFKGCQGPVVNFTKSDQTTNI